jgi:hypothetical protein
VAKAGEVSISSTPLLHTLGNKDILISAEEARTQKARMCELRPV